MRSNIQASFFNVNFDFEMSGLIGAGRSQLYMLLLPLGSHKHLKLVAELICLWLPLCKSQCYYFHERIVLLLDIVSPASKLRIMVRTVNCKYLLLACYDLAKM